LLGAGFALVGVLPFFGSLAALLLIGAGGLAVFPAFQALIAAVTPLHLRSQAFASVIVCVGIGAIVVAPATGALADAYGYRPAFVVLGLVVGVGGLVQASSARTASADLRRVGQLEEPDDPSGDQLVRMRGVDAGYDGVQVLFDVDLDVRRGEILALLGTNGAGKSTLLRVLSGLLPPTGGTVRMEGRDITSLDPVSRVKLGIVQMPGGKGVFPTLTVDEHLQLAGWLFADDKARLAEAVEGVLTRFPRLRERQSQLAGNLSGGEQQQLALGMALISRPVLLCIDELSLGLAPAVVETLLQTVREINASGTTIVVVEQSLNVALSLADRAYFLEKGSVRFSGPTAELLERDDIVRSVFLAGAQAAPGAQAPDGQHLPVRQRDALDPTAAVLEVREVRKSFGGVRAVQGVTLQVAPGEIVGLVGGNGAGKTTLFDLVSGFLVPDGGSVLFRGEDVTTWAPERRALAGLGRSFQDARIFGSLTVAENIAVALERHLEVRDPLASTLALPAAQRVERDIAWTVDDLVQLLGLDRYRDSFAGELSTGTRRVVDLAMSLAHDPDLLLLDEPSAGIAQRETEALGPLLRRVRAETGCALVVIEHDMPLLAGLCDRLVALELGAVLAEGRPEEVLADPAVVAGYLGGDPAAISRSGTRKAAP
jgi:branched-chain amino acid transport system ATP-binding protein